VLNLLRRAAQHLFGGRRGPLKHAEFTSNLVDLASAISSETDFDEKMRRVCQRAKRLLECDRFTIFLLEGDGFRMRFESEEPADEPRIPRTFNVPVDDPLVLRALERPDQITVNDARNDPLSDALNTGGARTQSIVVAPILDQDGTTSGLVTAELDEGRRGFQPIESELVRGIANLLAMLIAEKESQDERRAMEARLATAANLEPLSRFAETVAQDFKDRLTVVLGIAELVTEQCRGTDLEADLEELMRSAEAAAMLTQRLVELSAGRPSAGVHCNLASIAREIHALLRRLIPADVDLSIQVLEDDLSVGLSYQELERIISNLVLGAADACQSGDLIEIGVGLIDLSADRATGWPAVEPGRYAHLTVRDSGVEIDRNDLAQLFEPFSKQERSRAGHGLGLSTVYALVHGAGGSVFAESEPGEGTRLSILLPIEAVPEWEDLERRSSPTLTDHRATILLVEDNEAVRSFMREVLEQTGHRVIEAMNGRHALQVVDLTHEPIHLLVTDIVMPDIGGAELADTLVGRVPDLQILFISGYAPGFRGEEVSKSSDRAFLPKPFSASRLLEEVDARLSPLRRLN